LKRRRKYNCRNQFHTHSDKDKKGNTENKELKKEKKTINKPQHRLLGEQDDQSDLHHWHSAPSQIMALLWTSNCYHYIKGNFDKSTLYFYY